MAAVGLVVAAIVGFGVARLTDGSGQPAPGRLGTVDSIDPGSGEVCIARDDRVSCYPAPGLGLAVGDRVSFRVEQRSIDPADPGKGTRAVLVSVEKR